MNSFLMIMIPLAMLIRLSNSAFFNTTIGPYAICGKKSANIESMLNECYERCGKPPQPKSGYTITIHQSDVKNAGPRVVECRKVRMEQKFTKTWLFSTSSSEPIIKSEPASEAECKDVIARLCSNYECNIREPKELEGEYHYASDTVISKEFVTAISMPSSLTTRGYDIMIMPLSSDKIFKIADEVGLSDAGRYVWRSRSYDNICPFEPVKKYGCDYYDHVASDKHFLCARGGFVLTMHEELKKALPACDGLIMSSEGLVYSFAAGDNMNIYSQRLSLTEVQYKQEDTEAFRSKMNHVLANVDSDICVMQCELLGLEARLKRDTPKLIKVGSDVILLEPNGTGISCSPANGCKIAKPHLLCGNPPRIGLDCTGFSGFWNPKDPYMNTLEVCHKPRANEKMNITAGHHTYTLDDDLSVMVPSGFLHGRQADLFAKTHMSGLDFSKEEIDDLRASWVSSKQPGSTDATNDKFSRSIDPPSWGGIVSIPGTIAHYLAHSLKELIIIAFIGCAIIITMVTTIKILLVQKSDSSRRSISYSRQNTQEETRGATWI